MTHANTCFSIQPYTFGVASFAFEQFPKEMVHIEETGPVYVDKEVGEENIKAFVSLWNDEVNRLHITKENIYIPYINYLSPLNNIKDFYKEGN